MHDPSLEAALARGATIVTPNKRLAREIRLRHDRAQLAAGRSAWTATRTLPWTAFVSELIADAQAAGLPVPTCQLDAAQSTALWHSIIAHELPDTTLIDAGAVALLAAEAWERLNGFGAGGESWRGFADDGPDATAFARWAEAFVRETAKRDAIDSARAPDALARVASGLPGAAALDLVLIGFLEYSPQQRRLLDALATAGARISQCETDPTASLATTARLAPTGTPRDELVAALDWARERALEDPSAQVGIVVLDLAERRAAVRALAEDCLCAGLQWPGREAQARPYDLSVGEPLAFVPLVASALDLVTLAHRPLDRASAAVLVRSPYLPGAAELWFSRAAIERDWLEKGIGELSLGAWIRALEAIDPPLGSHWRRAREAVRLPVRATPREWAECWRRWLDAVGWLEGRALDSAEFQALGAWNDLVADFVRLAAVTPQLSREEALAALLRAARTQTFQPEAPGARIRILGLLEASGLAFDALWVAGFAADSWPQVPSPNPLIPIAWQRDRGVPRSSPERELEYARRLTAGLSHAAPEVVFSYAAKADDHERLPSPLVAGLPPFAGSTEHPASTVEAQFAARPILERIQDFRMPALPPGSRIPGGAGMLDAQSACPFRAAACYRLGAKEWPRAASVLDPRERGTLVHAALAAFWREVRDKATLDTLSEDALAQRVDVAVDAALRSLDPSRWAALPPVVAANEAGCVAALLRKWLVDVEQPRPDFTVKHVELEANVTLAGYLLKVRIDRVDQLATGSAIIDYKSGSAVPPQRWFDRRPQGPQLALYAAGMTQLEPGAPVRALVYGRVNAEEVKAIGIADRPETWRELDQPEALKGVSLAHWNDALAQLDTAVERLTSACGSGEAVVSPRVRNRPCDVCHLHALCRIGTQAHRDEAAATGDADE